MGHLRTGPDHVHNGHERMFGAGPTGGYDAPRAHASPATEGCSLAAGRPAMHLQGDAVHD
jgi:hypothetical protein